MNKAIMKLPDWEHVYINGKQIDVSEAEHILVEGPFPIPSSAFRILSKLKSVEIADDVTGIEKESFRNCSALDTIEFGKGLQYIDDAAFLGCDQIEELTIPGNIRTIGEFAFHAMHNLKRLTIEEGVESIGAWSFGSCKKLEIINLPKKSIKKISWHLFDESIWLRENPNDYVMVGDILLLYKGQELDHVVIPDYVKDIIYGAFRFRAVKSLEFGKNFKRIPDHACERMTSLETVTLPDGLEEIGDYAFSQCTNLRNVKVPDSLIRVGTLGLDASKVSDSPDIGCVYAGKTVIGCIGNSKRAIVKQGTYSLSPGAFVQKLKLETIILPDSIREINCSFTTCTHLWSIVIPRGVPASCLMEFAKIDGIRFFTWPDSEADHFAKENGIIVEYLDDNITQEEIIKKATKKNELKKAESNSNANLSSSHSEWFQRKGNTLTGLSKNGIEEIKKAHIKSITLPTEKEGYKLERLAPECLSILEEVPEVTELIIPEGLEIPGVTTTSGRSYYHFPNCNTIKQLVFTGKTNVNFYFAESLMFTDSLESIKIQKSDKFKSVDGVVYTKDGKCLVYYPRSKKDKKYEIVSGTERISNRAFSNVKHLEELTICKEVNSLYFVDLVRGSIKKVWFAGKELGPEELQSYSRH